MLISCLVLCQILINFLLKVSLTMADELKTKNNLKGADDQAKHIQIGILSGIVAVLAVCVIVLVVFMSSSQTQSCDLGYSVVPRDFLKPTVFEPLTPAEYKATTDFLLKQSGLNLVPLDQGTPSKAYIYSVDLLLPPKRKVLEHLDKGIQQPERKSHVIIFRGDLATRVVEEYEVGPLPKPTYFKKTNTNTIPYFFKPMDGPEYNRIFEIITEVTEILYPLLVESYNLAYHNCTQGVNCMTFYDVAPRGISDKERRSWFWGLRDVEGFYIHPLGLEMQIDHSDRMFSKWKILQIVYNGQSRPTAVALLNDYKNGQIKKLKIPKPSSEEAMYSSYKRRGSSRINTPLKGPMLVEPEGRRYKINGLHISYMDWDFHILNKFTSGVQLFNIKFQGDRIAYELSLQEACVFYSGYGPAQGITNYYDTSWLMGAYINELVPGVDCPGTATFLDVDVLVNTETAKRIKRGICIFEDPGNHPIRRHYATDFHGGYFFYGGLEDYRLVVRSIANVWNYDYIFDYIFHLNGAIEVKSYATGYLQAAFPLQQERQYGSKLQPFMMADIHQHLFNYKVDLDINGQNNRYATLDISTETVKPQWYPDFNKTQFKYELNPRLTEFDANFKMKPKTRYDLFYNDKMENEYGHKKAYRIMNLGQTEFLLEDSSETKAARWAKYPLAVSRYKDNELSSSSVYANQGPRNPVVDLESFLTDNDTMDNEDIVAWVTMGVHHIPHTEDVPSTTTTGSQFKFYLLPFNYFSECPSMSSLDNVRIVPKDNGNSNTIDARLKNVKCLPKNKGPAEFNGRLFDVN